VSEQNQDEGFKVIDRRPFTAEGEMRKEVVEEQEREAKREEIKEVAKAAVQAAEKAAQAPAAGTPVVDTPKKLVAFVNLVRLIGQNAAMVLGGYADPATGQPVIEPEAAREMIDMLDALHEKTKGNLAPEEDTLLLDLLGKLKMTYLEINQALTAQAMQNAPGMKARGGK
jgi:Domain of unknown function (DUF1844)